MIEITLNKLIDENVFAIGSWETFANHIGDIDEYGLTEKQINTLANAFMCSVVNQLEKTNLKVIEDD